MKEKELRLALVFFGGVSLAVYQHGINREILNLVRASKLFHSEGSGEGHDADLEFHRSFPDEMEHSTGGIYLEFLRSLGSDIILRVLVDVITGSSAGGINGITLAAALAHGRSLKPITHLWLEQADMLTLLAPEAKARMWSKWYFWPLIRPLLTRLSREGLLQGQVDADVAKRVSVFLRSRWFKPPLDGRLLGTLMLDGLIAMNETAKENLEPLLPKGARLDLVVTVTDFHGLERPIFIHDPPVAYEREHRHRLKFSLEHRKTGHLASDFDTDSFPSLAFAGRASASYPGAFPPAQLREFDDLLATRHQPWPGRTRFVDRNFRNYRERGENPEDAVLVDGSVLDNKPIMACVEAIHTHGALREVDRRLVYIDPHPKGAPRKASTGVPGFFTTLRGSLSDLPRQEPVYDELANISRYNTQARRLKEAILHARPQIARMIEEETSGRLKGGFTLDELRHWRLLSITLLASTSIVYSTWMRSLIFEALDFVVRIISASCRYTANSPEARRVQLAVEAWARHQGIVAESYTMPEHLYSNADLPQFARMILDFGLVYKRRRLNFVLHEINEMYPGQSTGRDIESENLDLLKIKIHKCLAELAVYDDLDFLSRHAVDDCRKLFLEKEGQGLSADRLQNDPSLMPEISRVVERLAQECDMARLVDNIDAVLASPLVQNLSENSRSTILTGYLGYFFWDIILRPTANALSLDAGPIEEILVDRISPEDASSLALDDDKPVLLGGSLAGFGGFLSRAVRENDYLWGRLHAADRLFDILISTAPPRFRERLAVQSLKKRAFERILDEERSQLGLSSGLIAKIEEIVKRL